MRRFKRTGMGPRSSAEREELKRLRRENKKLKEGEAAKRTNDILSKAAAWFANGEKT